MGKKWMLLMSALLMVALGGMVAVFACSSSQKSCTTDEDCAADEYCAVDGKCHKKSLPDGQDGDGNGGPDGDQPADSDLGPPPCEHDRECPPDQVCEAGDCVAGTTCNYDYNCDMATQYCHPEGKVCKDRSALCEPCTEHYECPDPSMGDMCIDYPDGKYCGMRCGTQACPVGYDCDPDAGSGTGANPGQCRSNTGSCEGTFVCHSDEDCAANKVCNRTTGKCVPKCVDDTSCPGGQKCHYTGHCGTPCASDADCAVYGDGLICCVSEGVPSQYCDANSTGKCRPAGCVLHSECLQTSGDSLGYCDKRTHTCMPGCRAADPASVNDCKSGMKCVCYNGEVSCDGFDCCPDPGEAGVCLCDPEDEDCSQVSVCDNGTCEKIPCNERGDVNIACARNQVCCGWPTADGYPCPDGVPEGDCYMAPKDIWCSTCGSSGDVCQVQGYGHDEPGICLEDSDGNTYCHLACRDTQDCPATWQCDYSFGQGCQQASDCEATATCESFTNQDGDQVSVCVCQADADCPSDFNGFEGYCADEIICDYADPQNPDCVNWKICQFAKACQCSNCCEELHSGG